MTWEIVSGLIVIAGFLLSAGAIVVKASQVITELKAAVDMLIEQLKDSKSDREKLHNKIDDHENRINILEVKVDNRPNN
jgi:septal ring factor EnvC (AmiA/AmiB activator)